MKKYKVKNNIQSGFTLIELMVATSIFMIIMLVAMGSLAVTSDLAKKSNALNFTMDNLNFAMESMTRSIRMGTNYYCGLDLMGKNAMSCTEGSSSNSITFTPAGGDLERVAYGLANREDGTKTIERCLGPNNNCIDIIATNININNLKFFVRGAEINNTDQPSAYIIVKGTVTIKNEPVVFAIQTMVSQRTAEQQ